MSQITRIVDAKLAGSILNSRITITRAHVGQQVLLTIQGSGTFQSAADQEKRTPGQAAYFDKYIYNLKANSQEAMGRPVNQALLAEALKAESVGNVEEATALFNSYLNAVQISFNVIADRARKFENGDAVTAFIGEADTKDGHKALVVNDVRYKAPAVIEKTKFNILDLIGTPAPAVEDVTADAKVIS